MFGTMVGSSSTQTGLLVNQAYQVDAFCSILMVHGRQYHVQKIISSSANILMVR